MIIAIDGNHAVGKSTIVSILKDHFKDNENIVFHKFPTKTRIGVFAKESLKIENEYVKTLLFCADYYKSIYDSIDQNKIIIMDRYIFSLFAFQLDVLNNNVDFLENLVSLLPPPDLQIIITNKNDNSDNDKFIKTYEKLKDGHIFNNIKIVQNIKSNTNVLNLEGFVQVKSIIEEFIS